MAIVLLQGSKELLQSLNLVPNVEGVDWWRLIKEQRNVNCYGAGYRKQEGKRQRWTLKTEDFEGTASHLADSEGESSRYSWWIDDIFCFNQCKAFSAHESNHQESQVTQSCCLLILDSLFRVSLSGCFTYWTVKCCCSISCDYSQTSSLSWRDVRLQIRWGLEVKTCECLAANARFKRAGQVPVNPSCVQVQ